MKIIFKCSVVVACMLLALSCNSWLDVRPKSEIRADIQFETESGFKDALIGIYIGLTDKALYSKDLTWHFVDILAQQYPLHSLSKNIDIKNYKYTSSSVMSRIDNIWLKAYNVIANINNELKFLEQKRSILDPINYSVIKGELLALRVYIHFDLMRLFGYGNIAKRNDIMGKEAIPYVTEYSKDITKQLTYQETFLQMEKDLEGALQLLKQDPVYNDENRPENYYATVNSDGFYDNRQMRMNYYAAECLASRLFLWQGKIQEAYTTAVDVIENAPYSWISQSAISNSKLNERDMTFTSEHLFTLNIIKFSDYINDMIDPTINNNYELLYQSKTVASQIYELNSGVGVSDYRYMYLYNKSGSKYVIDKLIQREFYNEKYANRIPLIKISEMYYIAAECLLSDKLKDLKGAQEYLEKVRVQRGITIPIPVNANEMILENELLKEYRKEFTCEGQLFYFYKRRAVSPIPGTKIETTDKNMMLPYPDIELDFGQREQ